MPDMPDTTTTPTDEAYARFGKFVAATLGSSLEWDSAADYLETFAEAAQNMLGVAVGDQDADLLRFWRQQADEVGAYYSDEEGA